MRKLINYLALGFAGAIFAALLAASPAQAAIHHSNNPAQIKHFVECFALLGTPEHALKCGPGHEFTGQFSHAWGSENYTPPAPETKKPCTPPPCIPWWCCHPCCPPPCEKVAP